MEKTLILISETKIDFENKFKILNYFLSQNVCNIFYVCKFLFDKDRLFCLNNEIRVFNKSDADISISIKDAIKESKGNLLFVKIDESEECIKERLENYKDDANVNFTKTYKKGEKILHKIDKFLYTSFLKLFEYPDYLYIEDYNGFYDKKTSDLIREFYYKDGIIKNFENTQNGKIENVAVKNNISTQPFDKHYILPIILQVLLITFLTLSIIFNKSMISALTVSRFICLDIFVLICGEFLILTLFYRRRFLKDSRQTRLLDRHNFDNEYLNGE